ncbi:DUF4037 domain-containing protein [Ornithinimicrobium sp. F0845]|uniref:DUF4037 domain-containing protein n=1 Tax=Ornithinimicrobium sp. F0845 TaxID=2926412 RepID=UPI001FF30499|nr:DUF4037 domain-containing protein [Ornithinimicrobium sp. F0845]MCK0111204.1 DUF4037 domain-containing protein [Ornithinimicrobium sp. F0845]
MGAALELCRRFYGEVVRARVDVPHSAGLLGRGSEVLGYDDAMSADHNCEARVLVFVPPGVTLEPVVPDRFEGRPTLVEVHTIAEFFGSRLGFDPEAELTVADWLTFPEAGLLMMTAGDVFHDDLGLVDVRARLAYYPDDVWRYLMIAAWWRVHPEMNLAGRAGYVGDELGSSVIGAQLVQDLMQLCFLIERRYAPYSKWLGTAFHQLPCGPALTPLFEEVLAASTWQQREVKLIEAYRAVGELHNQRRITAHVELEVEQLWGRPFRVLWGDFPGALAATIQDPEVRRIVDRWPVGGVDRVRDVLHRASDRRLLVQLLDLRLGKDAAN